MPKQPKRTVEARSAAKGRMLKIWADYDPDYCGHDCYAFYHTKDEQRSNRPDLTPFPLLAIRADVKSIAVLRETLAEKFSDAFLRANYLAFCKQQEGKTVTELDTISRQRSNDIADAVLKAIGLTPVTGRKGRKL